MRNGRRLLARAVLAASVSILLVTGPVLAETDRISAYMLVKAGQNRAAVGTVEMRWGTACSTRIVGSIRDVNADGHAVTYWRKFNSWPFDSSWLKLGSDTTASSSGDSFDKHQYYCDSQGAWLAACYKTSAPTANSSTSLCRVDYKEDNS
jgi:hypothetical protein